MRWFASLRSRLMLVMAVVFALGVGNVMIYLLDLDKDIRAHVLNEQIDTLLARAPGAAEGEGLDEFAAVVLGIELALFALQRRRQAARRAAARQRAAGFHGAARPAAAGRRRDGCAPAQGWQRAGGAAQRLGRVRRTVPDHAGAGGGLDRGADGARHHLDRCHGGARRLDAEFGAAGRGAGRHHRPRSPRSPYPDRRAADRDRAAGARRQRRFRPAGRRL